MVTGTVKWFNAEKSFGFITQDDGSPDVYVHTSEISGGKALAEGTKVEYGLTQGPMGPQAQQVTPLG